MQFWSSMLWVEGGFAASGLGRPIRELTLPLELLSTSSVRRPLQADGPGQGTGLAAAGCSSIVAVWQSMTSPMSVWQSLTSPMSVWQSLTSPMSVWQSLTSPMSGVCSLW